MTQKLEKKKKGGLKGWIYVTIVLPDFKLKSQDL